MAATTLESLLIDELRQLLSADGQLIKALRRMSKARSHPGCQRLERAPHPDRGPRRGPGGVLRISGTFARLVQATLDEESAVQEADQARQEPRKPSGGVSGAPCRDHVDEQGILPAIRPATPAPVHGRALGGQQRCPRARTSSLPLDLQATLPSPAQPRWLLSDAECR